MNEAPHVLWKYELIVDGRKLPRPLLSTEYTPLTQSVQVTLAGMLGAELLLAKLVPRASMFETERLPVYVWTLLRNSVTQSWLFCFELRVRDVPYNNRDGYVMHSRVRQVVGGDEG